MNVLIADDDEISRDLLEHLLRRAGYEVHAVDNGVDALEAVREQNFRLVITDWDMPRAQWHRPVPPDPLDGRERVRLHHRPARATGGRPRLLRDVGRGGRLRAKPFHPQELLVRLRAGERVLAARDPRDADLLARPAGGVARPETGQHLERVQRYSRVLAADVAELRKLRGRSMRSSSASCTRRVRCTTSARSASGLGAAQAGQAERGRSSR